MKTNQSRHLIFFSFIFILISIFLGRLFFLQVVKHNFFEKKASVQLKKLIKLYPNRGSVYDRNMDLLASVKPSYSIYAMPKEIENKWDFSTLVAPLLNKDSKHLRDKLYKTKQHFMWLDRQVDEDIVGKLKQLDLAGIGFIRTEKRVYPNQELAANILGFVGIDNQGLGGLEYKFDDMLKGSEGRIVLDGDPRGNPLLSGKKSILPNSDGKHIVTTIDSYIQYSAQKYLAESVAKHNAKGGQVVVMDPKTGNILAMASAPTFNPNQWNNTSIKERSLFPVNNVFEPGSIFKLITVAAVIEEDIVSPKTALFVPETLKLHNVTISEAHERDEFDSGTKTVTEIIQESLNVGVTLLAQKLGEERFYKYIRDFGFGEKTGLNYPGESKGLFRHHDDWSGVDIGMISFGQGIAVTGVQMARALSCIANEGRCPTPRLIDYITDAEGETRESTAITLSDPVISKETAYKVNSIMQDVVSMGTGKIVQIKGYQMAGKTGTAQKAKENGKGYEKGAYVASFIGLFPVYNPQFVVLVAIDTPQGDYYGSTVAGPVYKQLAEDIIRYYNIPPDKYAKKSQFIEGFGVR